MDFPEPISMTCQEINKSKVAYNVEIVKNNIYYFIELPSSNLRESSHLDKISYVLTLEELSGAEDGIYNWLLIDKGSGLEIIVKPNINYSEVQTKHNDILKDICHGNVDLRDSELAPNTEIRIFFGGELKKEGNNYSINFLSGTYSLGQVDPESFSTEFEQEITEIFKSGMKGEGTFNILRTNRSFIVNNQSPENVNSFEQTLFEYTLAGAKIYKLPKNLRNRVGELAESRYESQLASLNQSKKYHTDESYQRALEELNSKSKPLTEEELRPYLMRVERGGRRRRTIRKKNSVRKRRTIKKKNSVRKRRKPSIRRIK